MADYLTRFSCRLEVGAQNIAPALEIYQEIASGLEADDGLAIGFEAEPSSTDPQALWLHDNDGYGEPEHVIAFALRCAQAFDLDGRWGFCWALTCSRARLDGFGGGAQVLDLGARKSLDWVDCSHWLELALKA